MQHAPIRGDNILDLCFTTLPDQIKRVEVVPGMSDHEAVTIHLDTTVKYARKKPRMVYLFRKGNMEGVQKDLEDFKNSFLESDPEGKDVDENWNSLKKAIFKTMDKNIPKKQLSSWQDVPWIGNPIKRLIRKKKRLWKKARRTKAEKDWEEFRSLRKQVKAKMKKLHDDYVDGILQNSLQERPKKFWSFINSMKKDSNGIPTLKTDTGPPATNSKAKANVLGKQ